MTSKVANVNPDLARERQNATFDVEQVTNILYRGPEKVRRRRYLQNLAIQDPVLKKFKLWAFQDREEQYSSALQKHLHISKTLKEMGITDPLDQFFYRQAAAPHENSPIGLHQSMFIPTIEKQATEEQKKKWMPLAKSLKMIGTYAQTELGHGTFIRGLETTATYDPKNKEFILNSPTLTSMKYWPGNLGKTVNHCLVMAQLYTQGKCHGIHMFLVQLRDMDTHIPLPGVELGDIGPKFGYGTNDNGFLRFKNVRIPRTNMLLRYSKVSVIGPLGLLFKWSLKKDGLLWKWFFKAVLGVELGDIGPKLGFHSNDNGYLCFQNVRIPKMNLLSRYTQVLEDGTYVKPPNAKLAYGSMVLIRSAIVTDAARALSQACVISIRYSAVRRQTEVSPGGEEAQVLDYQTQQYLLLPLLATSYAMYFAGGLMYDFYLKSTSQIEAGDLSAMPQLHALSAGLKAFSTWVCSAGIEVCRMCCGGHGYSHASGLPKIYVDAVPGCTYEGENNVMMLQVARYLMKNYGNLQTGASLPSFVQYLTQKLDTKSCMTEEVALRCLVMAYEHRAARLVTEGATHMQKLVMAGKSQQQAWNLSTVMLTKAAKAHCHAFVVKNFIQVVTETKMDDKTKDALTAVCRLYAVHGIVENLGEFIQDGYFSSQQVQILQKSVYDLLAKIRPNAVALVDAFDYPDRILESCLGRYDGQVYQALYDYAKSSPLNEKEVLDSYYKYLQPVQKAGGIGQPMARL